MTKYEYLIIEYFKQKREIETGKKSFLGKEKKAERNVCVYFNASQGYYYDLNLNQTEIFNNLGSQGWEFCESTTFIGGRTIPVQSGGAGYSYTDLVKYFFKREIKIS